MVKRNRIATMSRIFAIVAVVVILGAALGAGTALAAKGGVKGKPDGNGGNGGNGGTYATLTVSPDPAPANWYFHAEGCGYVTGKMVNILVKDNGSTAFFGVGVDGNGCISFDSFTGSPGSYTLEAYQNLKGKKQTLMASTTFAVQ